MDDGKVATKISRSKRAKQTNADQGSRKAETFSLPLRINLVLQGLEDGVDNGKNDPNNDKDYDLTLLNLERTIGPLEAEVMEIVWHEGEVTVRDVYQTLLSRREIAYTTVLTVLVNLNRKRLVARMKDGQAYLYRPTVEKSDFVWERVARVVDVLLDEFTEPTMARLAERLSPPEAESLPRAQ